MTFIDKVSVSFVIVFLFTLILFMVVGVLCQKVKALENALSSAAKCAVAQDKALQSLTHLTGSIINTIGEMTNKIRQGCITCQPPK